MAIKKLNILTRARAILLFPILLSLILTITLAIPPRVNALIDYSKQNLIGSDLSNRDFKGVTFNLTNLLKADLSGSDLTGASLFGAKLQDANLSKANLTQVTLDSSVLENTNLSNAILEGAFIYNAHFKNVNITGADFTNAQMDPDLFDDLCSMASGVNPITNINTSESLGCN